MSKRIHRLLCLIGWHAFITTSIDRNARPPIQRMECLHCLKTATNFYDGR